MQNINFVLIFGVIYAIMLSRVGGEDLPEYKVKCRECGRNYTANVNRDGLCSECKAKKTAEANHKYYSKRKANGGKLTADQHIEYCMICDEKFIATGRQVICPRCSRRKSIENNNKKRSENTESLSLRLPNGIRDEMKDVASYNKLSLTSLMIQSYEFYRDFLSLPPDAQNQIDIIMEQANNFDDKYNKNKK